MTLVEVRAQQMDRGIPSGSARGASILRAPTDHAQERLTTLKREETKAC